MGKFKLEEVWEIEGELQTLTGLRIGGRKEEMEIGGLDNPIIREPIEDFPYIPGSSLKGKMRSLLELSEGKYGPEGEVHGSDEDPCSDANCPICRIFGSGKNENCGPTRLIVRDAFLTDNSKKKLMDMRRQKGNFYTEIKKENVINRLKGKAIHLRDMERVPQNICFDIKMSYRILDNKDKEYFNKIIEAMRLLEKDYLGGCGSRGYGRIKFQALKIKKGNKDPEDFTL